MENQKLLVCICFHYVEERLPILRKVIDILGTYKMNVDIIIDTNSYQLNLSELPMIKKISVHDNLEHPFYLTFMHRIHMIQNTDQYDWFMYLEDDMGLPYENFLEFTENFYSLWPDYVPSFIRIETKDEKEYVLDVRSHIKFPSIVRIADKEYVDLSNNRTHLAYAYHAFWIMPNKELKETMHSIEFFRYSTDREWASSFTTWEIGKIPLVRIENNQISRLCYSYHLSNNYVSDTRNALATIEVKDIFK